MKNFLIAVFALFLLSAITRTSYASDERLYIAELLMENDLQTSKTLISIFKPEGAKLKEVLINGLMARVSPDGKYIVYLELKESDPWEIVLSTSEGKKVKTLEFKRPPKRIGYPMPTNLLWSPDGENIAIVTGIETFVGVAVYNLKTNHLRTIYSGRTSASVEAYLYVVSWFSDGKRMLIAGSDGIRIIDTETKEEKVLSKESASAYLSGDGKKIIYGPQLNKIQLGTGGRLKLPSELYQYDTEKGRSELLMSLDANLAVLSQDGRYLVSQTVALKEATISIVDLLEKKVSKLDTKGLFLIPKRFSPFSKDFVICMGLQKNEDTIQYGILNLNNGEFRALKKSSSKGFEGEKGLILFMGFDWYDWR